MVRGNLSGVVGALMLAATVSAQDWKGMGRMEGRVLDPEGNPVADAVVKLELPSRGGTTLKTDKKGKWAIGGITSGKWNIDIEATGFAPRRASVNLPSEAARLAPLEVKLERAAPQGPSAELMAAVEKGDQAYKAGRYVEARAEYEKVLALKPELSNTLHELIARCYSQEGDYAKAVEHLQPVLAADPTNVNLRLLVAQEALRGGMLEKGMQTLEGVDESAIRNPEIYFNIAVILVNQNKPEEALRYLTKSVTLDPAFADGYFQRGMTHLSLQRIAEAKADFEKVIALAPGTPQAETARKALAQLP